MPEIDQSEIVDPPAPTPGSPAPVGQSDLDKWRQEIVGDITKVTDERFSGIQKLFARRDTKLQALEQTVEQLKSRTLSDDEREELTDKATRERLAAVEAENEVLRLSREYPAETVSLFEALLGAESAKDQLEILKTLKKVEAEQPTPTPTPTPEGIGAPSVQPASSEVDPNNPPADLTDGLDFEKAFEQDPSLIDKILRRGG